MTRLSANARMQQVADRVAGSIDHRRRQAARAVEVLRIRDQSSAALDDLLGVVPANDHPEYLRGLIHAVRARYGASEGEQAAVALFGSLAWSAELRLARKTARSRAERLFAANDGGRS